MTIAAPESRIVSHFRVGEQLGAGGTSVIYRATDLKLGRTVALKFLRPSLFTDPAMRQRLIDEARAASSLDHPNICTIFEAGESDDGEVFIAMACYDGETLDRTIARSSIDMTRAVSIALQAARGLAAAHEELIVHRDIKPGNLMLTRGDTIKILDFGLADILAGQRKETDGKVDGTLLYMSPEQLTGRQVDQRTDIWSLGVVLHEMLSGTHPFRGADPSITVERILRCDASPLPITDSQPKRHLEAVLANALAKDPRQRYGTIELLISDLERIKDDLDSTGLTVRRHVESIRNSIAVLPFADMTARRNQSYLCDGLAEEILRALQQIPDLRVASRTSAFQFKGRAADIRDIGAKLNVDTILEGSVRRSGNHVRVSAQLVNVQDGYRLWCERFDFDMKDIFTVEDEIAKQIANALEVTLAERKAGHLAPVTSAAVESYELYLQGREFVHLHRRKALTIAIQNFRSAIELDPENARAWSGLADCHSFIRLFLGGGDDTVETADTASSRALELAPDLPEAFAARGFALFVKGSLEEAERQLARAIEADPRLYDPHYISGRIAFSTGRFTDAARHFRDACAIVPEAYDSWYLLGMCYRKLQQDNKAHDADLHCIEGAKKRVRTHPDDTRAWTMGAAVLAELGEPDRAAEWVGRAITVDPEEPLIAYNAACVYTSLGRVDDAFGCLESVAREGSIQRSWMENDPDLDPLRSDPRFARLLESTKIV